MKTGFKSKCVPDYRLLTLSQIKELHQATLDLLQTTGVKVLNTEALQLLKDAGCRVVDEHIVKIPGWLVEESIASAPSSVTVYNRKGAPAITGFSATPMDMRTGTTVYASPDERLTHSACCDLYHYSGLPV